MFNSLKYLQSKRFERVSLSLNRITRLLELMGNPQDKLKCIHVAGTNGKGSTCAFISSILREQGLKTGMFTSPYIEQFGERIQINGENITDDDMDRICEKIKPLAEQVEAETGEHPTEFELVTALCFEYYAEQEVDIAVIEVGMGGRYDATNVIKPLVCVITNIGYDHMKYLGTSITQIALEKSGIIKKDTPVVIGLQEHSFESQAVIISVVTVCNNLDDIDESRKYIVGVEQHKDVVRSFSETKFEYKGEVFETGFIATYEIENACTAIETVRCLSRYGIDVSYETIYNGVKKTRWPGRFEVFEKDGVKVIVDGAHNSQGVTKLFESLEDLEGFEFRKVIGVFGCLDDKDYQFMINIARLSIEEVCLYKVDSKRAESPNILKQYFRFIKAFVCNSPEKALEKAIERAKIKGDIVVAFGSLYSVGRIRNFLE